MTPISRPTERMNYATCKSGCQLKQSTDVSAQLRAVNTIIPLMSIAFSVHRLWTVSVCKLSCVYPIIETEMLYQRYLFVLLTLVTLQHIFTVII